jgi:hypothetical protein
VLRLPLLPLLLLLFGAWAVPGHAPLLPRLWSDPYAIASVLHGAWRAYVVTSGMYYAYTIYASIHKGITQQQLVHMRQYRRLPGSGPRSTGLRVPRAAVGPMQHQPTLQHHLSLSLPVAGGSSSSSGRVSMPRADRVDGSLLHTIRERFDKATMVQVGACLESGQPWCRWARVWRVGSGLCRVWCERQLHSIGCLTYEAAGSTGVGLMIACTC